MELFKIIIKSNSQLIGFKHFIILPDGLVYNYFKKQLNQFRFKYQKLKKPNKKTKPKTNIKSEHLKKIKVYNSNLNSTYLFLTNLKLNQTNQFNYLSFGSNQFI